MTKPASDHRTPPGVRVLKLGSDNNTVVRPLSIAVGLVCALIALVLFAMRIGISEYPMSVLDVGRILLGGGTRIENVVVFDNQLPIGLVSLFVGFLLGLAGALTQTITRNPLASPDLLGITAGAAAGAVVVITLGASWAPWLATASLPVAALGGGIASAIAMYVLSWRGGIDPIRLVLVGVAMTAGLQAFIAFALTRAETSQVQRAQLWIVGSVSGADWDAVWPLVVVATISVIALAPLGRHLSVAILGDDVARALGVRLNLVVVTALGIAVLAAAVAVSSAGPIAFVALLAPQIAVRLTRAAAPGPVTSGLVGAVMVIGAEVLCRTVLPPGLPVGVVTAAIGGPALIYLMIRVSRRASA